MKLLLRLNIATLSLIVLLSGSACGAKFAMTKEKLKSKSSDQEVITVVCIDEDVGCIELSCDDLFRMENDGRIHDDNYSLFEEALAQCHHRGSSDEQDPELNDETEDDGEDNSESSEEDC